MNLISSNTSNRFIESSTKVLNLARPLILSHFLLLLLNAIPLGLMANFTEVEIATVALSQTVYAPFVVFGAGVMQAIGIIASRKNGSGESPGIDTTILSAFGAIAIISPITIAMVLMLDQILGYLGQSENVIQNSATYLSIVSFGLPASYLFGALRSFSSAHSMTKILLPLGLTAVVIEITLGLFLTQDCSVCPNFGIKGAAIALVVAHWTLALGMISYVYINKKKINLYKLIFKWATLLDIIVIGFPIGLSILMESSFMAILGVIIGSFGEKALATHGVALQIIAVAFALPLGLGQATTILISHSVGKKDITEVRFISQSSIVTGCISALGVTTLIIVFSTKIFEFYLGPDFETSPYRFIIYMVAAIHFTDTLQGTGMSLLRGFTATSTALACAFVGYWLVGVTLALFLGRIMNLGLFGVWAGFGLGLGTVAFLSFYITTIKIRKFTVI